jgi:putative hydrolase of the HAD superfamily
VNETYFRDAENRFASLLASYETNNKIHQELFKTEIENLKDYGYGIKGFVLSMIEVAIDLSDGNITASKIEELLNIGKEMLHAPVELLPGVPEVLKELSQRFKLIVVTKGDLLDQERKLAKSGLLPFFHHVEVLSEKKEDDYLKLLDRLEISPLDFLMVGNSLKSDVLPLISIGSQAIHVPFHTTWAHEEVTDISAKKYDTLTELKDIIGLID